LACAAACSPNPTTLLLELEGPPSLTSLDLTIAVESVGTTSRHLALTKPLPATVIVELPAQMLSVTLDVVGNGAGPTLSAHAVVSSKPHQQVTVPLDLEVPGVDGGGASDLGQPPDLRRGDLASVAPVARLISTSYFSDSNASSTTYASPAPMTSSHYAIDTTGVVAGDLLIIVANIDNGGAMLFPDPIAPGFLQLAQRYYGSDGQTYVAAWKIAASNEPASYSGNYGVGNGSGSAVLSLIAVSGANQTTPINAFLDNNANASQARPTVATSPGVTTTVPNCALIYAAGADWLDSSGGSTTFALPSGYSSLMQIGDHGNNSFDWTSQMMAWTTQTNAGATGSISGTFNGTVDGIPWAIVIAVAP
jgi:hypothetical protein